MTSMERMGGKEIENIIFIADGGIGKVIASTAVVRRISELYPDKRIIVVTGYPDIYLYNTRVYKTFNFGNPLYFYDDYVNSKSFVVKVEPYTDYGYMFENKHIINAWCDMIGIDRAGAMPELHFLDNEIEAAKFYVDKITGNGKKQFVMLQWTGGIIPNVKDNLSYVDAQARMHRRALSRSVAQKLVNKLVSRDFVVGVVQHENHPDIQGAERLFFSNSPVRGVIALLKHSAGFIGIDSFLHHAAAALDVLGVVVWGGTSPDKLGYAQQHNLVRKVCPTPFCHRPDSYVFDSSSIGAVWNCPYNTKCLEYDADEIVTAYEDVMGGAK
jgi:hypothetical protein